ncbi:hypothetical protein [Devosia sp.]|uniref:hypothetical protein n=1 Tax=Devosia sp. TaxID=1871048 RepID=UPI001AC1095A|nr:hypothetical protein [Devosia sp.]MBN9333982.1 hypothetical protein [Devosia sp.]
MPDIVATCHCGSVSLRLPRAPAEVTHCFPRKAGREMLGINARLIDTALLAAANIRYKDSADTGLFT